MSNADNSYTARLAHLRSRTQAIYRVRNPDAREFGPGGDATPDSVRQSRALGQIRLTLEGPGGELTTVEPCCPTVSTCEPVCPVSTDRFNTPNAGPIDLVNVDNEPFGLNVIQSAINELYGTPTPIPPPPGGYSETYGIIVFTPVYCNATQATLQVLDENGNVVPSTSITNLGLAPQPNIPEIGFIFIVYPGPNYFLGPATIPVTVSNSCSSSTGDAEFFCFLAGSPVALENGTSKPIETVAVGDRVIGAFGEINTVTGMISNNLGFVPIININGEHKTTAPHPHIATDHKFSCADPISLSLAYGRSFPISGAAGTREKRVIKGVNRERITKLQIGTALQTLTGPRPVTSLETIRMPPTTRVYHLTTDGSHSYTVDGYAVAGGATEEDFDYDTWTIRA